MNKELRDQSAHFISCLLLTLITLGLGAPVVLLWAFTREYYQHKVETDSFWENIPSWNLDLTWSAAGIVVGIIISIPLWAYLINRFTVY